MINKIAVKRNFSKYAESYDCYSAVQNFCASELIKRVGSDNFSRILDIGCGTGNYTQLLRERFPLALVSAIDLSSEMLEISKTKLSDKRIKYITADAEKIELDNYFDLISSNAAFQWFNDLPQALVNYQKALKPEGLILFSSFGPRTFFELNQSLKEFSQNYSWLIAENFISKHGLENMLKIVFDKVKVEELIYQKDYVSLKELLTAIKYTGTQSSLSGGVWTKEKISKIEKAYLKNFGRITTTYQIYFCRGYK